MIPVVLIHKHGAKDDRYPLDVVMNQAYKFGNVSYLLEDGYAVEMNMERYYRRAKEFESNYVHMSGNHIAFEKFCISRWYVLAEWMEHCGFDKVLYTDSDVLLYCNVTEQYTPYQDDAFTLALGSSAATSYFTLTGLEAFLDYVDSVYIRRNEVFAEFQRIYREMQEQHLAGGIADMTLFKFFREQVHHVRVGEMTAIHNGSLWDHNFNVSDGLVMEQGHKKVRFADNLPYGELLTGGQVRFNALHFQGGAKSLMRKFVC